MTDDNLTIPESRRDMDGFLANGIEANKSRLIDISERTSRLDALFESMTKEMTVLADTNRKTSEYIEKIAKNLNHLTHRLNEHAISEENQWHVINRANDGLERLAEVMNKHLSDSEGMAVRISWHERIIIALTSVFGTLTTALLIKAFLN